MSDPADMLEQYIALHEHSRDPQTAERAQKAIAEFRHSLGDVA